jgi:lycopene beta-cyclase
MQDSDYIVDYVFIGLGAANSLIIRQMHAHGILDDATLMIIDPDEKLLNDKTFCFWATEQEIHDLGFTSLISHDWSLLGIGEHITQSVQPYRYYHVSSITLYDELRDILSLHNVQFIREYAEEIISSESEIISVRTTHSKVSAKYVFDSRPPQWNEPARNETFLLQSFFGWRITTKDPIFDVHTFTMMDFSVDQSIATQFVYVLPFSPNHALIELTRFGASPIEYTYAQEQLIRFCQQKQYGVYTIESEEQGIIPMSTCSIKTEPSPDNLLKTGSAAGRIKPSTGYAFKEMAFHAIHIVESLKNRYNPQRAMQRSGRFAFYDRLLLKILESHPNRGKELFERLFQQVSGTRVLRFLEEQTSFIEDISVFMALPKYMFAKQAVIDMMHTLFRNAHGMFALGMALFFALFQYLDMSIINWVILGIGLLLIGIPHGAMDHVLTIGERSARSLGLFILGYVAKGILMLSIWIISPLLGLIIFLIYSMWHFGQTEYEQENVHNPWLIFLRGFAVLSFILATHIPETNTIINALSIPSIIDMQGVITSSFLTELSFTLLILSTIVKLRRAIILCTLSLLVMMQLDLLQAFGVYFVFHHSYLGWNHLKKGLRKTNLQLWELSAPFSISAIGTLFLFFINTGYTLIDFAPLFFVFLSCISFPHVLEMHSFYGLIFKRR